MSVESHLQYVEVPISSESEDKEIMKEDLPTKKTKRVYVVIVVIDFCPMSIVPFTLIHSLRLNAIPRQY